MKFLSIILASAIVQGVLASPTTACNADNCARAVTGTRAGKVPDVTSRQADCSSFQLTTVTPAPSTTYVTTIVTVNPPNKRDEIVARQVTVIPDSVPAYASACSGTARYQSACSCWGITPAVTTAPTPIVTIVVTETVTPFECNNPGAACGDYTPITDPSCGPLGDCICVTDTDGRAVCVQDISCSGAVACASDSDCPTGEVCWAAGCCTGSGLCAPTADVCPFTPTKMLKMLRRGMDTRAATKKRGCSNAGC